METNFRSYVENIMDQTECNQQEKEDMREELLIHLEMSKEDLMRKGMKEKEAERKAMELFGPEKDIGSQMQQSIFPFRKELMLTLSIISFLYTITLYLLLLFNEGNAHIGWLLFSMTTSTLLLCIALNIVVALNRRRWMNSLLMAHLLIYLYGYAIISGFELAAQLPLTISNWIILLLSLLLVYQTTIYEMNFQSGAVKEAKRLHQVNFVSGVIVIGVSLFFLWVGMMLFGGFHPAMAVMMVPFGLWLLLYVGQMKLVKKHKRAAFVLAGISLLGTAVLLVLLFFPSLLTI
ncbi:permease prefix domain 1-containing protein [Planococcus salinus]|uniref:Uncharacterized protein n=1 Tax=Planococcus salinus TaxID=1848460 RepID=A0A3M8P6Y4_9BACL|nr:permease prefix domain 1-containing protein [Planococcus salinus]RNF39372.1 hypothetical protein EEX84_09815 [Planococcus salinus]